jgi:RNA polymerase sigma factor (sigma-70 family)
MMQCSEQWALLQAYVEQGSEPAFTRLVNDSIDLVYAAALRQVRDRDLAQEVAQVVFIILARKARTLKPGTVLSAWLFKTTRYTALNLLRAEARRAAHERKAAAMSTEYLRVDSSWERLAPVLDEGIARLNDRDRSAIMLRFFERRSIAEVAGALGISEYAAGMRVHRAVERLRGFFRDKRVDLPATSLGGVLLANGVRYAPHGLGGTVAAKAICSAATGGAITSAIAAAESVVRSMFLAKVKATAMMLGAVGAASLVAGIITDRFVAPLVEPPNGPSQIDHEPTAAIDLESPGIGAYLPRLTAPAERT